MEGYETLGLGQTLQPFEEEIPEAPVPNGPKQYEPVDTKELRRIEDLTVQLKVVLGHATMPADKLLTLKPGAVIMLDRRLGQALDVYMNNRLVARGEVSIVDERLGVTMTEIARVTDARAAGAMIRG